MEYGFKYVDDIHNLACCRVRKLFAFYAILNRINYAFYNATEILKIIDVDSEMISGIIFVIYEDIFMSLFLAFVRPYTIIHTRLLRLLRHNESNELNSELIILKWCVTPRISELTQKLCIWDMRAGTISSITIIYRRMIARTVHTQTHMHVNQIWNCNDEQHSEWNSIKLHLKLVAANQK